MRIGIKNDSNYKVTYKNVLEVLSVAWIVDKNYFPSPHRKDLLVAVINELSFGIYLIFQIAFHVQDDEEANILKRKLLAIDESQLLIGREIDDYEEKHGKSLCVFDSSADIVYVI